MSGRSALRNFATKSMRNRTELMFQVVIVMCIVFLKVPYCCGVMACSHCDARGSNLVSLHNGTRLHRFARNDGWASPRIWPVRIGDLEQVRIELLGGVQVVDRNRGVEAL